MIMHNGMLRLSDPFGEKSDTAILADTLSRITEKWWENENRIKELEKFATGSKLIFMDKNQSFIVNENGVSAHWADDIWFSNRSYESYVYTQPKTTYVPPTYVVSDDYYEKRHKKGKGKYKGGYLHPSLVPQQPTPEQLSKIVEIQEWTTYKSSIQGCLDSEKRKNLNEMGMDETNWLWCLFADGQTLTLEEKKANIKEFYDFVMTKSFIQSK